MKTTTWKGIEIWTDFVWKIPKAAPEQESRRVTKETEPKKVEPPDVKFLEIDENWNEEELELYINKWKEDSKKYVENQFSVLRQRLKTALDRIADLVTLPETSTSGSVSTHSKAKFSTRDPNRARSGASLAEPTDEVGRKLYAALQGISKARLIERRAKSHLAPLEKLPEATLAQELESAVTVLKSPSDGAEKSLESRNCKAGEVENTTSELSTLKADDDGNQLESETLTPGEVENRLESATLTPGEVENRLESATLTPGEVENRLESATLTPGEVENRLESATLTPGEVENRLESATLTPGEVANPTSSTNLIAGEVENPSSLVNLKATEVENPSASTTHESDDAEKPMTSALTEQNTTEDEASRSVNQTILCLINRLTSESPREVFKNIDSDELRLQLQRFCHELGECTQKIGGLQESLEEKVVESIENNQTIVEFFARDALLLKGHSVPCTQEQTQSQIDLLLKLVKDYIQPLKCSYDVILDDVVCCLNTKNEILNLVENFLKLPFTEKRT